ncbi:MFS multidrug transporter [Fusarium oxysporum f. sp. phaseoli]
MSAIFCCPDIKPYRPRWLDHEPKFTAFLRWTNHLTTPLATEDDFSVVNNAPYAVQLVRQVNYGPQEVIRYFVPAENDSIFMETTETDLLNANFEKLNSYKNFRCEYHNKFFEVNLYQKNPTNTHHWRANLARPSREIDLAYRHQDTEMEKANADEEPEQKTRPDPTSVPQRERLLQRPCNLLSKPVQASCGSQWATSKTESGLSDSNEKSTAELDIAALKRVLRFLLPAVRTRLGSNPLLSLLCLDWINQELGLGISLEALWEAQLTSPNIIMFLCRCFNMSDSDSVNLEEIEGLVLPAMRNIQSLRNRKNAGRARLQDIVYQALEDGRSVPWCANLETTLRACLSVALARTFSSDAGTRTVDIAGTVIISASNANA